MKKRIMIVGPENNENSQLVSLFEKTVKKQEIGNIVYWDKTIQVPSSYMRSPSMLKHLIATQQKASCILMMLNAKHENKSRVYPPNLAKSFRIPRIGVISVQTKSDDADLTYQTHCQEELLNAGVDDIFLIDFENEMSCQTLLEKIK